MKRKDLIKLLEKMDGTLKETDTTTTYTPTAKNPSPYPATVK